MSWSRTRLDLLTTPPAAIEGAFCSENSLSVALARSVQNHLISEWEQYLKTYHDSKNYLRSYLTLLGKAYIRHNLEI